MSDLKDISICLLFGSLEIGGAERQGLLLARHLKDHEMADVQVWGLGQRRGPVADQCDTWGIPWRAVPVHWGLRRRLFHLVRIAFLLRQERPSILISYTKVPNLVAALVWRLCGVRLCVWNQADAGLLLKSTLLHRHAVAQVTCFIANSDGGQQYLLDTFGLQSDAVRLIRNGVVLAAPRDDRACWRKRLVVEDETFVAVMVANLSSYKDHATLLDAWHLLLGRCSGSLPVLVLAGRFDDRAELLQEQAVKLGIASHVRFLGGVDDISGLLKAADLCVHCSPSEGIPNAVLEAMAAGLVVVGSDIPGLREAVGEEGSTFLAPPADSYALAGLVERLMSDPDLRQQHGVRMQSRAVELFGLERMCHETVECLKTCLGECNE
jgi:glycosyltransferase involved in cell wall biosynthesis